MFEDLVFKPNQNRFFGGIQAKMAFDNGYGVSVITGGGSYTSSYDEFELAIYGKNGELCYDTPITDDVLGWLTGDEVFEKLAEIQSLPMNGNLIEG